MEVTDLLHAAEQAIADAEQNRRGRREAVLWLTGSPALRLAARRRIRAKTSRTGDGGRVEWGYTLRQARRIRRRILNAFAEHARDTGAAG